MRAQKKKLKELKSSFIKDSSIYELVKLVEYLDTRLIQAERDIEELKWHVKEQEVKMNA